MTTRTGIGFDSHAFSDAGTLVLGGVSFPGVPALRGHSDGDALLHAIIDALLGAAGAGDIGELFPDTAPDTQGISSVAMLSVALERVRAKGLEPANIDAVVVADRPKLAPSRAHMSAVIAKAVGIPSDAVSLKGKTQEGLTWFAGGSGGIAVWATATLKGRSI